MPKESALHSKVAKKRPPLIHAMGIECKRSDNAKGRIFGPAQEKKAKSRK